MSDSFSTPWTAACQAPLPMGLSGQDYWGGWPFPPPGGLPDPGIEPVPPAAPVLAGGHSEPLSHLDSTLTTYKVRSQEENSLTTCALARKFENPRKHIFEDRDVSMQFA